MSVPAESLSQISSPQNPTSTSPTCALSTRPRCPVECRCRYTIRWFIHLIAVAIEGKNWKWQWHAWMNAYMPLVPGFSISECWTFVYSTLTGLTMKLLSFVGCFSLPCIWIHSSIRTGWNIDQHQSVVVESMVESLFVVCCKIVQMS